MLLQSGVARSTCARMHGNMRVLMGRAGAQRCGVADATFLGNLALWCPLVHRFTAKNDPWAACDLTRRFSVFWHCDVHFYTDVRQKRCVTLAASDLTLRFSAFWHFDVHFYTDLLKKRPVQMDRSGAQRCGVADATCLGIMALRCPL